MRLAGSILTMTGLGLPLRYGTPYGREAAPRPLHRALGWAGIGLILVGQALQLWNEYL